MTLNAVIALILRFFTEFDRLSGRLYHCDWRQTYNVRKILSPSSSLLLLAKTIMHPAARSLCDSWASCFPSAKWPPLRLGIQGFSRDPPWKFLEWQIVVHDF